MKSIDILVQVLDYIEEHLQEGFSLEVLAQSHYISLSHLHRLFACLHRGSLKEYIEKRKLSRAARDINLSNKKLIDIAFDYGYHSYEVFSRAFKKCYGCSPRQWRRQGITKEFLPRIHLLTIYSNKEGNKMISISNLEAYFAAVENEHEIGEYILCFDIDQFESYNKKYSWHIGDLVIEEAKRRIDKYLEEEMESYRIGGDEFIVLTKTLEKEKVLQIVKAILSESEKELYLEGHCLKFKMSVGIANIKDELVSHEVALVEAQEAMLRAKQLGRNCYYGEEI
nr:diguanylate cyclase [uncultured Niameybacter sp.]